MMFDPRGRTVKTVEEAESFIRTFIAQMHDQPMTHATLRSHDYDLYLPWLMEVVEYLPRNQENSTPPLVMERLYIEAAWSLVQQGLLRPGPRKATSIDLAEGYGKGYSLTYKGDEWLQTCPRYQEAVSAGSLR